MKNKFSLLSLFILMATTFSALAQMSDREKFTEALYLMDENRFEAALPYLLELKEERPDNANLNYNIGVAYLNSAKTEEKKNAINYLEKAVTNVSPNYTPFSIREKKAPVDAYYYYGLTLHSDYQFDDAITNFLKFKEYINEKHYLYNQVDRRVQMSNYAKQAIQNPRNIEVKNLGSNINSKYRDFSPVIRIDESAIYYTSRRLRPDSSNYGIYDPVDGMFYEDIYVSFNENGKWSEPTLLNINIDDHMASINLSVDGKTLFIYEGENGNGQLLYSDLLSDSAGVEEWSKPQLFGSDINTKHQESHVAISPDEKTLYFVSDRPGGQGGKDIYTTVKLPNGNWAASRNIGPILNSKYDEDGVFLHPDGKTLYFSSNGHNSMGGYDIFSSKLTENGWTEPANVGYPINSVDNDVFFVTSPDGKRAYFSSFKEGGFGEKDIYMLTLIDGDEIALTLYRGEFTYVDRPEPPAGATVTITNNYSGELVGIYNPRQRDGQFSAILVPNNSYHFIYEADDFETYEEDIFVPEGASYQEIYKDIKLKPVRVGGSSDKIIPVALLRADVSANITKNGIAATGVPVKLLDENDKEIDSAISDENGNILFKDLDPSKTYQLEYPPETDATFFSHRLNMRNDKGEELTYNQTGPKKATFVPSKYPFEFYGIQARSIAGTIKDRNDNPMKGLVVKLEDKDGNLIAQKETDLNGEFSFDKLSLENNYRLIFDGSLTDEPFIIITNELGEQLTFRNVGDGIYEYVPKNKATRGTQIIGRAMKDGVPIAGAYVELRDANGNVIQSTTTDEDGNFVFSNLDLEKEYEVVFDGAFPDDPTLAFKNEFDQSLTFKKTGKGVYKYMPSGSEDKGKQITGVVSKNGNPIAGLKVILKDINGNVLQQSITDNNGNFTFKGLNLENSYKLVFDGDFPDNPDLVLINEFGQELNFKRTGNGEYEYIPGGKSKLGTEFNGTVTKDGKAISGVNVSLKNKSGQVYQQTTTDENGFNFKQLNLNESYVLDFGKEFPDDAVLTVKNEFGQELTFVKTGKGTYEYIPKGKSNSGTKINGAATAGGKVVSGLNLDLLDEQGNVIESTISDEEGKFNFSQLNLDRRYQVRINGEYPSDIELVFTNEFGEQLTFMKVKDGLYEFVPRPIGFPMKSYTLGVRDEVAYKDTYPMPKELKDVIVYFQKYFPYNAKDITETNKEFVSFVNDIADIVERRGEAKVIITSSASKVPTKTWKSNSILTKRRANDTKRLLEKVFKEKGISENEYNFVDINTLITGPEYKNDAAKNKATYEKHQYVRIFIK